MLTWDPWRTLRSPDSSGSPRACGAPVFVEFVSKKLDIFRAPFLPRSGPDPRLRRHRHPPEFRVDEARDSPHPQARRRGRPGDARARLATLEDGGVPPREGPRGSVADRAVRE